MTQLNTIPLTVGTADVTGMFAQDLGTQYVLRSGVSSTNTAPVVNKVYRMVFNNSATTLAAGAALIEQRTSGCRNGKVTTTTTANDPTFAGIVPAEFGSGTVAASAYFLMQIAGPGSAQFSNTETYMIMPTTATNTACSGLLGTATVAGYLMAITNTGTGTTAALFNDIGYFMAAGLAMTTASAVVTAAGQLGTINLVQRFA